MVHCFVLKISAKFQNTVACSEDKPVWAALAISYATAPGLISEVHVHDDQEVFQ